MKSQYNIHKKYREDKTILFNELYSENTQNSLDALFKKFSNYDKAYICVASLSWNNKVKLWLENLWNQYQQFFDPFFIGDFKVHFTQRSWELYLGATFLNHGFSLIQGRKSGPDFAICDKDKKITCWVEAIAPQKGDSADRVPEVAHNVVTGIPTE